MSPACRSWGKASQPSALRSSVFVSRLYRLRHRQRACKLRGPPPLTRRALPVVASQSSLKSRAEMPSWLARSASRTFRRYGVMRATDERAGDLYLVGRAGKRRGLVKICGRVELPGNRSDPGEGDSNLAVEARGGNADDRKRPLPPVHRLEVGGRVSRRNVELQDQLVGCERRDVAVLVRRQPIELRDRKLTPRCAQGGAKREQRRRD